MRRLTIVFVLCLAVGVTGCGLRSSRVSYNREDVDLGLVSRVAVLPFANNSKDQFAAERVRNVVITQVLALGIADVVDKGIVDSVMREEAIEPNRPIDLINLKRLGQRLNVQAFVIGTIDEAEEIRRGSLSFPELAMTIRLVDSRASMVLWQASGRRTSETWAGRLFGLAPGDSFHNTLYLTRDLLKTLSSAK